MIPLDEVEIFGLKEDPDRWERLIEREQLRAEHDKIAAAILESTYWERDRNQAFERFITSLDFRNILDLLGIFRIAKESPIVEVGGGSGFLSWALNQSGFSDVSLLEPNVHHITGTGYLRSRDDASSIAIENSLEDWYASPTKYQTVVTRNCIHHFPNIVHVAAAIRQKIEPSGYWVVVREPYVESAAELYRFLHTHPYSQRYRVFEFAFPPSHYVNSIELAGFRLRAVVPSHYANNSLSLYQNEAGSLVNRLFTRACRTLLGYFPAGSVFSYRIENWVRSILRVRSAAFSRPQVMLFQRRELGDLPPDAIWYPLTVSTEPSCP